MSAALFVTAKNACAICVFANEQLERSCLDLVDVAASRYSSSHTPGEALAAAGRPWSMRLFGPDSIFTSFEALPFVPDLVSVTLRAFPMRGAENFPGQYPMASSPQAWSGAAPLLFLRKLLGLEPVGDRVLADPAVPKQIEWIELLGVPGRWGYADAFARGLINV